MITIQDILDIDNTEIYFFDHYKEDHPSGNHLYWGELSLFRTGLDIANCRILNPVEKVQDRLSNPEWKNNDLYLIPRYMSYGDYDNSCMVERSNKKVFMEQYDNSPIVYEVTGGYGSESVALSIREMMNPDNDDEAQSIIDLLNGLNDYPCIDDELMSNMEYEAFYEALDDYGIEDTCRALAKKYGIDVTDYDREKLKDLILEIDRNGNPVFMIESGGGCYIDVDDMIVPKISREQFISVLMDYEVVADDYPQFP